MLRLRFALLLGVGLGCSTTTTQSPVSTADSTGNTVADAGADAADAQANLPPRICKTPGALGIPTFTDVSAAMNLGSTADTFSVGSAIEAADVDGDGFADLFVAAVTSHRQITDPNWAGKPLHFLLMNRADPAHPGQRKFVDTTAESGLLATRDGKGNRGWGLANLGDLNNDGHVDAVLCPSDEVTSAAAAPEDACDAMLGDGQGHFSLAPTSELNKKAFWVPGSVLLDYDRDGFLDFWPSTVAHWPYNPADPNIPPTLFRGDGTGAFTNVSKDVGLPTKDGTLAKGTQWRHVFGNVACDLDGDGDDDMVFASYGREECQAWLNDGGQFSEVGHQLGLDHDDRVDYSDDVSFRCFCAANPTDKHCQPMPPAPGVSCVDAFGAGSGPYFRGWMPGITDQAYSLGGNYFSFACGDIDDDGDMDLLSATIVHGDVGSAADPSELILNPGDGSKFTRPGNVATGLDRPEKGVYWNHGESMAVMVDVDLDGLKDVMWTQTGAYGPTDTASLFQQQVDGTFVRIDDQAGLITKDIRNYGVPAWIDIDGDGDLDLVSSTNYAASKGEVVRPWLIALRNDQAHQQNLVRIHLDGGATPAGQSGGVNRSAIGARVRVTAGGRTQTHVVMGGYGHGNAQHDLMLTVGLGAACDIDAIEVRWPDSQGTVSNYKDIRANRDVTLTFGSPTVVYGTKAY